MKAGFYKLLFVCLIMLSSQTFGQNPEWINYTDGDEVYTSIEDDSYYWVGTRGGLSRVSKSSGEVFVFTKANSDLPDNFIYCMTQDSAGNKWLGTFSQGIVKFDGSTFTVFNSSNTILPDNKINSITLDHQNNIWVGTDSGLVKYDGVNWTLYDFHEFNFDEPQISTLFVDTSGELWVSLTWWGLVKFDGLNWIDLTTPSLGIVKSIAQGADGSLWFGGDGVAKYNGISWATIPGAPTYGISCVAIDTANNVWIGLENIGVNYGIRIYNGSNWIAYDSSNTPLPQNAVNHIRINQQNEKIIGTYKGFFKVVNNNWTEIETSNSELQSNRIENITIDPNGKKWISGMYGFSSFDNELWSAYPLFAQNYLWYTIHALKGDVDNIVWIGHQSKGLLKFDGTDYTVFDTSNSPIPSNWVSDIQIAEQQIKWIGTANGLVKYDGINWTIYNTGNSGISGNAISSIAFDNEGNKWIAAQGLSFFNDTSWVVYNTSNSGIPSNSIGKLAIDHNSNVWFSTYPDGLVMFDGVTWTVYDTSNSILPTMDIYDIAVDQNNVVWIGCAGTHPTYNNGGLVRIDGNQWELFNSNNSELPWNYIMSVEVDQFNNKWIGMYEGGVTVFNENGITLPVELISFTAEVVNNTVNLKWSTASELNNRGFEVERKQVGSRQYAVGNVEWNTIGFVEGKGTQSQTHNYNFIDSTVNSGNYSYRLKQIDFDGSFTYSNTVEIDLTLPNSFSLSQNYPNPFNPTTKIKYTIPFFSQSPPSQGGVAKPGWFVSLKVYDILGREVTTLVNEEKPAGSYEIEFNASNLASGVYFYSLNACDFKMTKKMILIK